MSRVSEPDPGCPHPAGLRALAGYVRDALNDAAARLVTPPPALAGPGWMAVEVTPEIAPSEHRPRPGSATRTTGVRAVTVVSTSAASVPEPHSDEAGPAHGAPDGDAPPMEDEHVAVWQLVSRAQTGDGDAFGQLYDRYVDTVYRFIYFRVNDRTLAEDFTSETFLRALRRIGTISYQGRDIGAWFVTIARNIVLDHMKSARHRLEFSTADTIEGDDRAPSPEAAVLEHLTNERLMAAVRELGEEQRECVLLRFIQGFSVSETAAVMGKNDGAVKALQHRAVRKLADLIGSDLA